MKRWLLISGIVAGTICLAALTGCTAENFDTTQITSPSLSTIDTATTTPSLTTNQEDLPEVPRINAAEVKNKIELGQDLVIVDVRDKSEYETSHIRGAESIPINEFSNRLDEFYPEDEIIIYTGCSS